jgi:protein-tyrosine phosphatase
METTLEMLRMAAESGTTDIVATPHKNVDFSYNETAVAKLFQEVSEKSTGIIKIHLGCDFHLSVENIHEVLENPHKFSINGKGYLLSEMPNLTSLGAMRSVFSRMIQRGIKPVITHPERIRAVESHMEDVEEWVRDGCLIQVTAQSLAGRFGSRAQRMVEELFSRDLVHFVASDAHDVHDRVPILKSAYSTVVRRWGSEKAEKLFIKNPAAALAGEPIRGASRPKKSALFSFLRR